ncbi:hypothetical protein HY025_02455 [Candidatus Daviesbacteria bacterium]|nr:hypothetical protein [Candidatus Daviesbacteria bacterium]
MRNEVEMRLRGPKYFKEWINRSIALEHLELLSSASYAQQIGFLCEDNFQGLRINTNLPGPMEIIPINRIQITSPEIMVGKEGDTWYVDTFTSNHFGSTYAIHASVYQRESGDRTYTSQLFLPLQFWEKPDTRTHLVNRLPLGYLQQPETVIRNIFDFFPHWTANKVIDRLQQNLILRVAQESKDIDDDWVVVDRPYFVERTRSETLLAFLRACQEYPDSMIGAHIYFGKPEETRLFSVLENHGLIEKSIPEERERQNFEFSIEGRLSGNPSYVMTKDIVKTKKEVAEEQGISKRKARTAEHFILVFDSLPVE